jgi:hypothetical protein
MTSGKSNYQKGSGLPGRMFFSFAVATHALRPQFTDSARGIRHNGKPHI